MEILIIVESKYNQWIRDYGLRYDSIRSRCEEATMEMIDEFPELTRVRGHVSHILSDKISPHWWCKDEDGTIWDPTSSQFVAIIEYIEHDESQSEPTGKCLHCGEYCYDYNSVCGDKCRHGYINHLSRYWNVQ